MIDYSNMDDAELQKRIVDTQRVVLFVKTTALKIAKMRRRFMDKDGMRLLGSPDGNGALYHEITMMAFDDCQKWHDDGMTCANAMFDSLTIEMVRRQKK